MLNQKLKPLMAPMDYKVLYGGRGSGKSWGVAEIYIELSRRCSEIFLCARELQVSIDDSVKALLVDTIYRLGYQDEFDIQNRKITHKFTGSRFAFIGLKNNVNKVRSFEGAMFCWVEEAENVSKDSWETLIPTIRKDGAQVWVTFNPANILDDTYQRFVVNPPKNSVKIKLNYVDNPHFTAKMRRDMEELKEKDYDLYLHVWEGEPVADSEHAIIRPSWISAAVDAHIKLSHLDWSSGENRIGLDIADEGEDSNALTNSEGSVITDIQEWKKGDVIYTAQKAYRYAEERKANIVFDNIGVGAGCKAKFRELNEDKNEIIDCFGFNAGGKVINPYHEYIQGTDKLNKDHWENLKAQSWGDVAQLFKNTYYAVHEGREFDVSELISLDSTLKLIDKAKAELSRPQVAYSKNGKTMVESKADMKKRDIPSTNIADSIIMARANCRPPSAGVL